MTSTPRTIHRDMQKRGFTLIETLVAITILMISIAGPLTIASKGLTAAVGSRDQVVASYLAQDLMEYIKNIRDADLIADQDNGWSGPFLSTFSACNGSYCGLETAAKIAQVSLIPCATLLSPACQLYVDSVNGYYVYSSNSPNVPTQFYRAFTLTPININSGLSDGALLTVTVSWKNGTINNSIVLKSVLFNTLR